MLQIKNIQTMTYSILEMNRSAWSRVANQTKIGHLIFWGAGVASLATLKAGVTNTLAPISNFIVKEQVPHNFTANEPILMVIAGF